MLVHHSSKSYEEAASEAAAHARNKLESLIENGRPRAAALIETVREQVPHDMIVPAAKVSVLAPNDASRLIAELGQEQYGLHPFAIQKGAERLDIPPTYMRELIEKRQPWALDLAAQNFNAHLAHSNAKYLFRAVKGEVRGWLSDHFRRIDSRPVFDAFASAAAKIGAMPVEGYVTDTKVALKAIIPAVFEPVPNEVMSVGMSLENSDFGNGAFSLRIFMLRLFCTNYAILDECLRQIHLGGRLSEDFAFSQRTYNLDTKTMASAVTDVVTSELAPAKIKEIEGVIVRANEEKVDPGAAVASLRKRLSKGETEAVVEAFKSADIENLPQGNTLWRMSNAVSWVAGNTEDVERKLDLMKVAGELLKKAA
jgi:hypothetical protein